MPPNPPPARADVEQAARPSDDALDTVVDPGRRALASTVVAADTGHSMPGAEDPRFDAAAPFDARYEVRASLGEGGMGEVRVCRDTRVGRDIAMKTVRAGHGSRDDLKSRFLREARVQGQLEHPSIVPVYELGRDPSGALYFTMKRVRGQTLEQIIDRLRAGDAEAVGAFSRRRLLGAFGAVCQAIHFAHTRGVLHRDLKPANVMIGDFGEVYVLDWGLAKVRGVADVVPSADSPVDDGSLAEANLTAAGALMGTPGYMAPEQVRGEREAQDERTDVYALGAILFEIVMLQPLHAPRPEVGAMLLSTLRGEEARAAVRDPAIDAPPELEAAWLKAIALQPEDRFVSARELHDAVERYLDGGRDLARRRELAREHAELAAAAATRALSGREGLDEHRVAMREVGRAIALDPGNADAVRTVVRLLTEPPKQIPKEVEEELRAARRVSHRETSRVTGIAYASWFLYLPFCLWMGVANLTQALAASIPWLLATGIAFWVRRRQSLEGPSLFAAVAAGTVAIAGSAVVAGPYIILPCMAVIHTIAWLVSARPSARVGIIAFGAAAVLAPYALEATGVTAPFYDFHDGTFSAVPHMLAFPPLATKIFFAFTHVALVVTAALILARLRDELSKAERRMHVQAWQLRQIVPPEAQRITGPPEAPLCAPCAIGSLRRSAP